MEMSKVELHYHEDTELRLGLPGCSNKRRASDVSEESTSGAENRLHEIAPPKKVEAIGWPPIRSYRKNSIEAKRGSSILVKVSMDGAPYLRKIDLQLYDGYNQLFMALENMFKLKSGKTSSSSIETQNKEESKYEATYEDKDGDWMLVGDVPWEMFITSCKRLRITKSS
ncbi:hypothetical protein RND81_04G026300 [Saponaria officinalis]|uniref:Auxin-responsive protein n=1 Tax=Saponaria officinalis TaxID=3572 RepID=A0AAW1LFT4_SAPOF